MTHDRARSILARRARRAASRGYTMIEVLMGMAILAVGASGIIALQKVTVLGVTNGRNINTATMIAAAHLEAVRTDATRWQGISDYGDATLLDSLHGSADAGPGPWVLAADDYPDATDPGFGISDVNGMTEGEVAGRPPIAYCTHLRLVPVVYDPTSPRYQAGQPGGGDALTPADALLIRVEARTFWSKAGRDVSAECTAGNVAAVTNALDDPDERITGPNGMEFTANDYGWVFMATGIRPNYIATPP